MTIEQAKSELMQIYGALSPDKQRAIDTLVKIEPCEDCISRQTILDGIEELKKSPWATDKRNGYEYLIAEALDVVSDLCIKQAPSVNPQEPSGDLISLETVIEWLKTKDIIKLSSQEETARKELKALPSVKQEPKYCDRNICIKNEYNGIGCDECEVTSRK